MGKLARERPCSATAEGTWRRDPNLLQDLRLARVPLSLRVLCTQITRVRFGPKPAHADVSRRSSALHSGAGRIPFRKENQLEFARDREEAVRSEEFLAAVPGNFATSFGTRSTGFGISRSAFPPWDSTSKLTCERLPVYLAEPLMTRPGAPCGQATFPNVCGNRYPQARDRQRRGAPSPPLLVARPFERGRAHTNLPMTVVAWPLEGRE